METALRRAEDRRIVEAWLRQVEQAGGRAAGSAPRPLMRADRAGERADVAPPPDRKEKGQ